MSEELARFRRLQLRLWQTRWLHEERESAEEDTLLDEMEDSWWRLSEEERNLLNDEGPRCWPMDPDPRVRPPELAATAPPMTVNLWSYEGFRSAAEAISSEAA